MFVTDIRIHPHADDHGQIRATADVILNDSLSLKGIKIMKGQYGLFLAFPTASWSGPITTRSAETAKARQPAFETVSMRFRKELQDRILKAYWDLLSKPMPLFG